MMWTLIRCFRGPRLYRLYRTQDFEGKDYERNVLEYYSDVSVKIALYILSCAWSLGVYTSPLLGTLMYRKGYLSIDFVLGFSKFSGSVGFLICVLMIIRGFGRFVNSDYLSCIASIDAYKQKGTMDSRLQMAKYDFDFHDWPVDFRWDESALELNKAKKYIEKRNRRNGIVDKFRTLPCDVLSYFAIHSFGRGMIYPGSLHILNAFVAHSLMKSRAKQIEDHGGKRYKLLTEDRNEIDSMFIDRRNDENFPNGNILVICCEGNAGFYEYGITQTPTDAGYSVLGWNHPGFGHSTGLPFPDQELNAMDVVIKFALTKLDFKIQNVVIYAWSIGGFSATWAAMNYPDIKGLVLDATFDDLVHLAIPRMPQSWRSLVVNTIRNHMDLNNAEQLIKYDGPVLLYRRSKDEIISTVASRSLQTNRGNDLLIKLLQARYPKLVKNDTIWVLKDWLAGDKDHQTVLWSEQGVEEDLCNATIVSYIEENGQGFPMLIGDQMSSDMIIQLLLFIANKYMIDYDSTHCITLPGRVFQLPWDFRQTSIEIVSSDQKAHY